MLAMANMKPESRKAGRKVAMKATWLARSWLLVSDADEDAQGERADQEDRGHAEQQQHAAAQGHVEEEAPGQHGEQHVEHADGEVGRELAEDQLAARAPAWR